MFVRTFLTTLTTAAALIASGSQPTAAQNFWEAPLRWQLQQEQSCELGYLTNLKVDLANGGRSVSGRAHCNDGRAFEVERSAIAGPFIMRRCLVEAKA